MTMNRFGFVPFRMDGRSIPQPFLPFEMTVCGLFTYAIHKHQSWKRLLAWAVTSEKGIEMYWRMMFQSSTRGESGRVQLRRNFLPVYMARSITSDSADSVLPIPALKGQ